MSLASPQDAPTPGDLRSLPERCAALALRLCPMAIAHIVCETPGAPIRRWSVAPLPPPPPLQAPPEWGALLGNLPLSIVEDAGADPRLSSQPEVCAVPGIRAAVRLRLLLPDGLTRVSLWLLDSAPRRVGEEERAALRDLAHLITAALSGAAPASELRSGADPATGDQNTIIRLNAALRNATDLVAINDAQGVVRYISPSVTRILGYRPEEMIGQPSFAFLHPDDLAAITASFQRSAATPGINPVVRMRFRTAAGSWRILEAASTNLLDDPVIRGVVVNARDVTEHVLTEQQHKATEARFLAIFESAPVGVVAVDAAGRIVLANPALAAIFGYEPDELVGRPLELVLPAIGSDAGAQLYAEPEQSALGRHRDGGRIPIDLSQSSIEQQGERLTIAFVTDIRARVRAEEALRESEERYRRLIELAPDAVLVLQGERIAYSNRAGLSVLAATTPAQVVGQPIAAFLHPDDLPRAVERVRALMSGAELPPTVHRIIALDGQLRLMEAVSTQIQDAGAPAVLVVARDITQRRRQEEQARFQASVLDQMDDAVVAIDPQQRITYLNPAAERQYGQELAAARGMYLGDLFTVEYFNPGDEAAAIEAIARAGVWRGECRHLLRDGRSLVVELVVVALRGEGAGSGLVAVIRDITVRKRAEERLHLLESVVVHAHDGIVITDAAPLDEPGPCIRYVNSAFTAISGYSPEEVLGRSPRLLQGPQTDQRALREIRAALQAQRSVQVELCNYTKAGEPIWLDLSITPVHTSSGQVSHFIAIQRDITQRKQLEAQLLQAQKLESIGRLAGGVAHDFNNLLTAIGGYTDLVLDAVDDPGLRADVEEIRKGVDRAAALTRHLLVFARRQPHSPQVVELNSVVAQVQNLLQRLLGPDVALHTTLTTAPTAVRADPTQLDQVLINLAVNARDAMSGSGSLDIRTELLPATEAGALTDEGAAGAQMVRLTVTDSGCGMSEAVQAHLFEPFFTTKPPGQGTGLGLATCYGIVRQHGGRISITSQQGVGTSVTIELPHHSLPPSEWAPEQEQRSAPTGQETVLVVDDESAVRSLASRVLRSAGYGVYEGADGAAAVALLEAAPPGAIQLVLTDVLMPVMNGQQLGQWAAEHYSHARILYMSGHALLADGDNLVAALTPMLAKPFTAAGLLQAVRAALDARVDLHAPSR